MTNEQLERAIEFLLENQAKHDARIQALLENQAILQANQIAQGERIEASINEMNEGVNAMIAIADRLEKNIILLSQVQVGTSQRVTRLEERVDRLEDQ